jgi:hypothetical protein
MSREAELLLTPANRSVILRAYIQIQLILASASVREMQSPLALSCRERCSCRTYRGEALFGQQRGDVVDACMQVE